MAREVWGLASCRSCPGGGCVLPVPDRTPPYVTPAEREAVMLHALPTRPAWRCRSRSRPAGAASSVLVPTLGKQSIGRVASPTSGGKGRGGGRQLVQPLTPELRALLIAAGVQATGPVVAYQGRHDWRL